MPISGDRYTFTDKSLDNAPDEAGVYALYDGDELIYIGRAQGGQTTIRTRLKAHKAGSEGRCTQNATAYRREVCTNPVTREKELLEQYRRQNGTLPRCNERVA